MANRRQILDVCDAKLAGIQNSIQAHQDAYAKKHDGKFFQGLRSHSVTPADGAEQRPDIGTRAPADQPEPYPAVIRNAMLPFALQVDVYDGPSGTGYTTTAMVVVEGQEWQRVDNEGAEEYRARDWAPVPSGALP